jgi:RNA recognition motif-containing protein
MLKDKGCEWESMTDEASLPEKSPTGSEDADKNHNSSSITCNTTTLFVGGLHPRIGDLHLQKLFSPYGSIVRIHIVTHKPGAVPTHDNPMAKSKTPSKHAYGSQQSKGYAFVEYGAVESARMAMERLDGRSLLGRNLAVRPAKRQKMDSLLTNNSETRVLTAEEAKKEQKSIQSKIDSVKKALEQKKKGL